MNSKKIHQRNHASYQGITESQARAFPRIAAASIAILFVLLLTVTASAQDRRHVAVLVTGMGSREFTAPQNRDFFENLRTRKVSPGIEVNLRPQGRFSPVISFDQIQFGADTQHFDLLRDRFTYLDENQRLRTVELPGQVLAAYDRTSIGRVRTAVGTLQVNIRKNAKIEPFVGVGGGVGLAKRTSAVRTFVHPLLAQLQGFQFRLREHSSARQYLAVVRGVAGVNVYPMRHVVLSLSCGYQNGAVCKAGTGFVVLSPRR